MARYKMSKIFHYYIDLMRKSQRGHIKIVIEKDLMLLCFRMYSAEGENNYIAPIFVFTFDLFQN